MTRSEIEDIESIRVYRFLSSIAKSVKGNLAVDAPARWVGSEFGLSDPTAKSLLARLQYEGYGKLNWAETFFILTPQAKLASIKIERWIEDRHKETAEDTAPPRKKNRREEKRLMDEIPLLKVEMFLDEACSHLSIDKESILGHLRRQPLAGYRQALMYCVYTNTALSYPVIGRLFNRDHSTVVHAYQRIKNRIEADPKMRDLCSELSEILLSIMGADQ